MGTGFAILADPLKTSTNNAWETHWPLIAWSLLVAFLLLAPGGDAPSGPVWLERFEAAGGDKLVHGLLFLAQAALLARSGRRFGEGGGRGWLAAGVALAYGAVLEFAQDSIPGRGFEVADLAADAVGAFLWPLVSLLRRG